MNEFIENLYYILEESVNKCNSNLIALSGGLDSSIIAYYLRNKKTKAISVTASDFVGTDLTYCQMIANKFGIPLQLKKANLEEILNSLEETIKILKNFNDIEIRNQVTMHLILKTTLENNEKRIITGDGADELFAGYNFLQKKSEFDLEEELERMIKIMHFPSKKLGKALGITIESPFLDDKMIEFSKKVPVALKVKEEKGKRVGKWLLRKAFEEKLPKPIVWREKSPMQDGSGTSGLTGLFEAIISDKSFESKKKQIQKSDDVIIRTKESMHYYEIYRKYFDEPSKLHKIENICPNCKYAVDENSKFCRMCGSYPI